MFTASVKIIEPDSETCYLVGLEGLVWVQPAIGDPVILAARNQEEQEAWAAHVAGLLAENHVPYGMPMSQREIVATYGGPVLRDCEWIPWAEAPAPVGDLGDDLPTKAAIIAEG